VKELLSRTGLSPESVGELIFGNVCQPVNTANIARVIALKAGLPTSMPSYTVHRNCASGSEAVTTAAAKIIAGQVDVVVAGGTESMSNIPLLYGRRMTRLFATLAKAGTASQRLKVLLSFRPGFLKPVIGVAEGLTDPVCGMIMGMTAEVLAKEFHVTREEQDAFALLSHQRAAKARADGIFEQEIVPLPVPPKYRSVQIADDGPRDEQSIEALQKLRPFFDRANGTVTVGNACPLTDGAAALLVMSEEKAKEHGFEPLGYLRDYAYAGLEPERMGLGPAYATAKLLKKNKIKFDAIDFIELNEAFAAQVIANERAFDSDEFGRRYLSADGKIGEIDRNKLNVNGGAIALGHPVGTTGARLILTLLKQLRRTKKSLGLATMCIGGGQGGALLLEAE
jgi:acetyl-CoA acetyltransferase family protein